VALVEPLPHETPALVPPPVPAAAIAGAPTSTSPLTPAPTSASSARAATQAAPVALRRDCGQLAASKRTQEALTCYQEQAAQNGLAGETALYELARLWRDSFGQLDRALAAFQAQRARFPSGVLRTEADLSIIELLPRLDRHADALAESEQFLAAHPKAERSGEIHLLRGNIFREVLRDLDHAEREYARGAEAGGRVGDDSRFMHAVCLEALGRVDQARKAYETYLLQSGATHAPEAKKRLERLRP
jgi:tetratricopeptide (TPR) repeat protein